MGFFHEFALLMNVEFQESSGYFGKLFGVVSSSCDFRCVMSSPLTLSAF